MKVRLIAFLCWVALVGNIECACGDLVFVDGSRSVVTAVTYGGPPDGGSTTADGHYLDTAASSGSGLAGGFMADASQDSTTPATIGPGMFGSGGASTSLTATGLDGFSTTAESKFLVNFMVNMTGFFSFDAMTHWSGDVPPFATGISDSLVELKDITNDVVLAVSFRTPAMQGTDVFSGILPLTAGVDYRVTAHAGVGGGGTIPGPHDADSGFSFNLAAVPEAGSVAMMTLGTLVAAGVAWWKRNNVSSAVRRKKRAADVV